MISVLVKPQQQSTTLATINNNNQPPPTTTTYQSADLCSNSISKTVQNYQKCVQTIERLCLAWSDRLLWICFFSHKIVRSFLKWHSMVFCRPVANSWIEIPPKWPRHATNVPNPKAWHCRRFWLWTTRRFRVQCTIGKQLYPVPSIERQYHHHHHHHPFLLYVQQDVDCTTIQCPPAI